MSTKTGNVSPLSRLGKRWRKLTSKKKRREFLLDMLPKGSVGAEIGVDEGAFSRRILDVVEPAKLHLVDPWRYEDSGPCAESRYGGEKGRNQDGMDQRYQDVLALVKREVDSGQVIVHRGASESVCSDFDDNYFDWVYVDGNHLYEFVKRDLELYLEKLKPGGFLTGDDYKEGGWWKGGVKKAVDEFVLTRDVELFELRNRQFILRKATDESS